MITTEQVRVFAMALPEVEEKGHFEKTSFRVRNKIIATMGADHVVLKLTVEEQTALVTADPATFYLPGWNHQGWTGVKLESADPEELKGLLVSAFRNVAPKRIAAKLDN